MTTPGELLEVEATGETVGEAKWLALRELEKLQPGLDQSSVVFDILSEGERGLLGVGRTPAHVIARATASAPVESQSEETELAGVLREVLGRIADGLGPRCRVQVVEESEAVHASLVGGDLGLVIGKHGQTIDAIQYLTNAIVHRRFPDAKPIVVDAAGYRERRRGWLEALALRNAEQALQTGQPVALEPMSAPERKLVHLRLENVSGVETRSEGDEPNRYVVIAPSG
jgi:spoIIIJ-associated protein